ncbi:MAG TPA: hypothetical protein PKD53_01025 [Chloroflexaceae bacterium]|nr:hypothetical protein [Chloroflexaceae bacterium]
MSIYDQDREDSDGRPGPVERAAPGGRRPSWIWIPIAVTALLIALLIITGFIYGG